MFGILPSPVQYTKSLAAGQITAGRLLQFDWCKQRIRGWANLLSEKSLHGVLLGFRFGLKPVRQAGKSLALRQKSAGSPGGGETMKRRTHPVVAILAAVCLLPALALGADEKYTLASGTTIETTLTTLLTSKTSEEGDPFSAQIVEPVFSGGEQVIPAGATLEGHVAFVKPPGRVKGKGQMRLVADKIITQDGVEFPLSAGLQNARGADGAKVVGEEGTVQGPGKSVKDTAKESTIDAGLGAGVGAIADGGTGALYGLGAGAITGIIHNLVKHHKDLILPQGTDLTFVISRTVVGKKSPKQPDLVINQ
jgi:hypothetical protein